MEILDQLLAKVTDLIPTGVTLVVVIAIVWAFRFVFNRRYAGASGHHFRRQIITLLLSFAGLLVVILTLPVSESTVGQLLSLLGILLSAAIALSSTTFVGNIMAGLMLRAVKNFRHGDWVRVGEHFGRITERGLFHIEIQTEDRDLTTLPNLFLVTNPVKVVRSDGTLVTAEVSLGYDVPRTTAEEALLAAAADAGLEEPFVQVVDLGDFSITYRSCGLLTEVKSLISTRSSLRTKMVDQLHRAGIEIVSPSFMNQRVVSEGRTFIPKTAYRPSADDKQEGLPEAVVFDKADEAESLEKLREKQEQMRRHIESLKSAHSEATDDAARDEIKARKESLENGLDRLTEYITEREKGEQ